MCLSVYLIYRKQQILMNAGTTPKFHFRNLFPCFEPYTAFSSSCMGGWVYVHVHIMVEPHLNYFSIYITWKEKKKKSPRFKEPDG